jgi:hypothetical protein
MLRAASDDSHAQAEALNQIIVQHECDQKLQRAIRSADASLPFD